MIQKRNPRVLMGKHILEGHDRGAKTVLRMLRDAGVEVVYIIYGTPDEVVAAAREEDADVIGLSFFSGAYFENVSRLLALLREKGMEDVQVIVGGLIPDVDQPELLAMGVAGVFGPGADLAKFIEMVRAQAARRATG